MRTILAILVNLLVFVHGKHYLVEVARNETVQGEDQGDKRKHYIVETATNTSLSDHYRGTKRKERKRGSDYSQGSTVFLPSKHADLGNIEHRRFSSNKPFTGADSMFHKPVRATMSSTRSSKYSADKCIDGDIVGRELDGNMCHSHFNRYPWLAIDYGKPVTVDRVEIFNRRYCCGRRTRNVDVRISNKLPKGKHRKFTGGSLLGHFTGPAKNGQHIVISG